MNLSVCTTAKAGFLLALGSLSLAAVAGQGTQSKDMDYLRLIRQSGFTENRGQWDSRALFLASSTGKNVWLTKSGFVIDLYDTDQLKGKTPDEDKTRRTGHVVSFKLDGANSSAAARGATQIPRKIDFIRGGEQGQVYSTSQYKEAYVDGVYNGVNMRAYLDGGDFRYDLIALPGANTNQIKFSVGGADRVRLDDKGNLVIHTSFGELKQSQPAVYQQVGAKRTAVSAQFTLNGNSVGFKLGNYNPNLPLVIDPLVYGSYLGADARNARPDQLSGDSQSDEVVYDAAADSKGNLYMTGYTTADNFPIQDGPYGFDYSGFRDAFLVRMAADAYALDYAAFIGGTGRDEGRGIGIAENAGIIWMGGVTTSADFPGATNTSEFTASGFSNAFWFMRIGLNSVGTITPSFSKYYVRVGQASFADVRNHHLLGTNFVGSNAFWGGMAVAPNGGLYFAGDSNGVGAAFGPFLTGAVRGGRDGFIQRFNGDGSYSGQKFIGSRFTDTMGRIAATPDNGVLLTGGIASTVNQDTSNPGSSELIFPTTAGVFPGGRLLRNNDGFVVKMTSALTTSWSAVLGGASNDRGEAVATDSTGAAYVLSIGGSFDFPRTRGVYDAVNENIENVVTKISATGSTMIYSTGLRHANDVHARVIKADNRGVAVVAGMVGFHYPGGTPPQPMVPGSIPTTPDADDPDYTGGDDSVYPDNTVDPTNLTGFIATTEGFVQFLNPTGTDVLYASYVGGGGDEEIHNIHIDRVGATWLLGYTKLIRNANGGIKADAGIPGFITSNAFKETVDTASFQPKDGFAIKLRVGLPVLTGVAVDQAAVAGGLGASINGTVTLENPAPAGGVVINLELSNPSATSFTAGGGQSRRSVVVPAGATTATVPIYTSAVTAITNVTLRATLDNDFLVTEFTVNPWLTEMTVTPGTVIGGNQVNLIVRLFQNATQDIRIPITTSNNVLIAPPTNNEIIVPAGSATASLLLDTGGVDATTTANVTGSLLGVAKVSPLQLTRAELTSVSFNPDRILSEETTTMTVSFNGKVGSARTIAITQAGGVAVTINGGQTLPRNITIPTQTGAVTAVVKAPRVTATSSSTLRATAGGFSATGTFFIDPIDILSVQLQPGTNVLGGTVVTGFVTLTRPAGQVPLTFNIASSVANAGTFDDTTVTVPAGSAQSDNFTFTTNYTSTQIVTAISASRAGFTTRSVNLTIRPIVVNVAVNPSSVLGGSESANVGIALDTPAPAGGLTLTLTTNNAAAVITPSTVTIPAGATSPAATDIITVNTEKVATDQHVTVKAALSSLAEGTASLTVRAPAVTSLVVAPTQVTGGGSATGTVTVETEAPVGGMVLNLASSSSIVHVPATVTVLEGQTTASFAITTNTTGDNVLATITATGSSSSASADLLVVATNIARIRFTPAIVRGGVSSTGTITLSNGAPAGGLVINLVSDQPDKAKPTVNSVTIPAGQTTATFTVTTVRVSRRLNVGITATIASTGRSSRGTLGIEP